VWKKKENVSSRVMIWGVEYGVQPNFDQMIEHPKRNLNNAGSAAQALRAVNNFAIYTACALLV
jgi:hypothetical protein